MEDKNKQADKESTRKNRFRSCTRFFLVSTFFGVLAVLIGVYCYNLRYRSWFQSDEHLSQISLHARILFTQNDMNGDGYLTMEEFEPIASRIKEENVTHDYSKPVSEDDEVLSVAALFQPLKQETMTKDLDTWFHGNTESLNGLKTWVEAAKAWQNFGASHFKPFLPDNVMNPKLCEPYSMIPTVDMRGAALPSNRYLPSQLYTEGEILLHRLLSMLHPRVFVYSRFEPQGAKACVRAYNDKYIEVVFRIHAEFQLNVPPAYPFWFTPAQFTGHIIMDRKAERVLDFHMYVPNNKRLNVDMEWLNGPVETENMEVDIGYMPEMDLKSTGPSQPAILNGHDIRENFLVDHQAKNDDISKIQWDQEMSFEKAARTLEVDFYPFKKIEYLNFTDVWDVARDLHKPVHSILLWGALDDQSC